MLEIQMSIKAYDFSNPTVKNKNKYSLLIKKSCFSFPKSVWGFHFWTFILSNFEKWKYMLKNEKLCDYKKN